MQRRHFIATTLASIALRSQAAGADPVEAPRDARRLRRARDGNLTSLDPHRPLSAADMEIAADVFCGLTAFAASGDLVPGCAQSWQIDADGTHYRFRLRANLRWSDGTALTAEDFVFSFRRLLDPQTAALLADRYTAIRGAANRLSGRGRPEDLGVSAPDRATVEFLLDRPETDLLQLLAIAYVVPAAAIARHGRDWAKPPQILVNGAFEPRSWAQNGSLVLAPNAYFHDARAVGVQQLEWVMGLDDATRLRMFRAAQLDIVKISESSQLSLARREFARQLHSEPYCGAGWLGLQTQRALLSDLRLRRALALAVDSVALVEKVRALGERATDSLVPDAVRDYPRPGRPEYAAWSSAQRLSAAKQLMREAGYSATRPVKLVAIYSANPLAQRSFLALAAMWQRIGVQLETTGMESRAYSIALRAGAFDVMDYQAFSAVQSATSFIGRFHSGSFLNYSRYSNPQVDHLIDEAERQPSAAARAMVYSAAEQILLRDLPAIPLYCGTMHRLVSDRVSGWTANPGIALPSRFLYWAAKPESRQL